MMMQRIAMLAVLAGLAALPDKGDTCAQWSSYDRRSRYEDGKYLDWAANGDGTGCIRTEGDRIVLAEMKGPGCIWRIWSALAQAGHVKVYLDGAEAPAIDLPFDGYFNRKHAPFVYGSLVYTAARGRNNYVPIPYAKSCRIVAEKGWGRYFQFVYETFPKGTRVPTFSMDLPADAVAALEKADAFLGNRFGADPAGPRDGEKTLTKTVTVGGGESAVVADLDGPRAITAIRVDNFGTAPGVNLYKSLPLGMTEKEFYCLWYMPFAERARIEIGNGGKEDRRVTFRITHAPLSRPIGQLGRFHAKWHRDAFLPEDPARRAIDWTLLTARGRGRFCGVMLHVWNPRGGWWGEGDEKFFVDGEHFPSTIGTGSEDYFGYAWATPAIFHHAYHNQTIASGNKGHVSVNRWHVGDNIPFQTSFEGAIEKYYPNAKPTLYAAVAYWYQAPGGEDPYKPVPIGQRTGYYVEPEIPHVKGALEGEKLKILSKTAGNARPQDMAHYGPAWSGESQLWWTGQTRRQLHQGHRLRRPPVVPRRQETGLCPRPLQRRRRGDRARGPWNARTGGRQAQTDGRDHRRQPQGREDGLRETGARQVESKVQSRRSKVQRRKATARLGIAMARVPPLTPPDRTAILRRFP